MTIVMQSSSAAAATTLVALHAGSLTFEQGCAMIVGQSVGTAGTTALVMIGGGLAVRRAALAHILFSVIVGVLGMLLLGPLTAAADWVGSHFDDPDGVLALAAFSSIFKLAGHRGVLSMVDRFWQFIVRITGRGSESAVSRLDPTSPKRAGRVALEAAWRATLEVAQGAVDAVRRRLAGESVNYDPPAEAVQQIEHFLESLSLETTDMGTIGPRLVRLCHALDHLTELHDDLTRIPSAVSGWQPPAGFEAGAQALAAWLDATKDPGATPDPAIFKAVEDASKRLSAERKTGREEMLEDVALQRMPMATARASRYARVGRSRPLPRMASGRIAENRLRQHMSVQSREVLVIGAGIAGLTAARDLAIDGYDVAILEARERIGGRIWTSHELGLPADLGASWIHGFEDNPIARLARRHDIAIVRTNISSVTPARYRSMALYDEDGHRLSSGETAEMSEMMADYLDFVAAKQKEGHEKSMLAVEELFAASQGYDPDHRRRLTFIARTYLEHEWAGPRSDVSLLEHDKSLGFAGHDRVFPEGYAQITDRLAEGTDILLGHEVTQIDYSGARVDVLTTAAASSQVTCSSPWRSECYERDESLSTRICRKASAKLFARRAWVSSTRSSSSSTRFSGTKRTS